MISPHDQAIFTLTYGDLVYMTLAMLCFYIAWHKWRKWKMFDWVAVMLGLIFLVPVIFLAIIDNYVMRR